MLCAVTEGLQIPAEARTSTCQSLSQPCGCQLPFHKGAGVRAGHMAHNRSHRRNPQPFHLIRRTKFGTFSSRRRQGTGPGPLEVASTFPPHPAGRACRLLLKEKVSPCGDAKIPSEAGLAPSGSPAAQIYGMMHHFLLEEKALKNRRAGHWAGALVIFRLRYSALSAAEGCSRAGASACAAAAALAALMS